MPRQRALQSAGIERLFPALGKKICFISPQRLQLIDHFRDYIEAALPKGGVFDVDACFLQNLFWPGRAAVGQQL
jgi:hypothetical protein